MGHSWPFDELFLGWERCRPVSTCGAKLGPVDATQGHGVQEHTYDTKSRMKAIYLLTSNFNL